VRRGADRELPSWFLRRVQPAPDHAFAAPSRVGTLPWLRDPMIQLTLVTAVCTAAIGGGLAAPSPWGIVFGVVALAAAFLGAIVLLRSVRHGWNIQSYGLARKATRRAATFRMESEAMWAASEDLARLASEEGFALGRDEILQSLFAEVHHALGRLSPDLSLVLAEEKEDRFHVICAAGKIRSKPYYVAPSKSCVADRDFPDLLTTFAPNGSTAARLVVLDDHRFWVGIIDSALSEIPAGERLVDGLGSWVILADAVERSVPRFGRTGAI
jgi:hypothetical protein